MTVYVSPLEMDSTKGRLIDLPMDQDALETLLCEMGTDFPLYVEASDYCGRSYLAGHLPEDMELSELNLLARKLAEFSPHQEIAFEGLKRSVSLGAGTCITFHSDDPDADNTLDEPTKIVPVEGAVAPEGNTLRAEVGAQTFALYRIPAVRK